MLYTVSNATLRQLGELEVPIDWCIGVKETYTVVAVMPWIVYRFFQGRYRFVSKRLILCIVVGAVVCEIIGAQNQLWAYATVGLIIASPAVSSSQLIGSAVIGLYALGDRITRGKYIAIFLLLIAIILLSVAKIAPTGQGQSIVANRTFIYGTLAAVIAGLSYSFHVIMIRYAMQKYWNCDYGPWFTIKVHDWIGHDFVLHHQIPSSTPEAAAERRYSPFPITLVMVIVTGVGALYYNASVLCTRGVAGFVDVPMECWFWITLSGVANTVGFFFQIQGLLLASAAKVSLISTTQIVLLTIIGIIFFKEPISFTILLGILFAICGVFYSSKESQ